MKRILPALLGALLFSTLGYDQEPGLNVFILAVFTTALLLTRSPGKPIPWWLPGLYLYTGLMCFVLPWPAAILMHLLSLTVLVGAMMTGPGGSTYLRGFLGGTNLLFGLLVGWVTGRMDQDPEAVPRGAHPIGSLLAGVGISLLLLWVFASLYGASNPLFASWMDAIDLSFLSVGWVWFTLLGFLLYYHILNPYQAAAAIRMDQSLPETLLPPATPFTNTQRARLRQENLWGTMALGSLCGLLGLYLVLDWAYLIQTDLATPAMQSEAVHQGVGALIVSILLAMALLLVSFRGNLNFYEGNQWLLRLSRSWLLLNALLLTNAFIKNGVYVLYSGLTFKRLGVFLFLLLVGIGLATVLVKIRFHKSLIYLVRKNTLAVFGVLTVFLSLPWSPIITAYNLATLERPDLEYLLELDPSNRPQLYRYAKGNPHWVGPGQLDRIDREMWEYRDQSRNLDWREQHLFSLGTRNTPR